MRPQRESFCMAFSTPQSPEDAKRLTDEAFNRLAEDYDSAPTCACGGKMTSFPGPSTPWPMKCEDCGKRL